MGASADMIVPLQHPTSARSEVMVRVPSNPRAFKSRPGHVSKPVWVAAKLAGLSLAEARELHEVDMRAIFAAFHMEADGIEAA